MSKIIIGFLILIVFQIQTSSQNCGNRQLDPRVAYFLKLIGYQDLSLEQLRKIPIEQFRQGGPPIIPYPEADVQRIKITADSIPLLIFNPLHKKDLPIIIVYHGGGFFLPLAICHT